jgi:hypothetical protein
LSDDEETRFQHSGWRALAQEYGSEVLRLRQEVRRLEEAIGRLEEELWRRIHAAASEKEKVKP